MNDAPTPVGTKFTDTNLIFLVSQPRAGSTLLQSILAGSEAIHTTAEPWLMLPFLYALRETGHTADYDARVAARALHDFLDTLTAGEDAYFEAIRILAIELYSRACSEAGKSHFLDKTPRYYKILPELARTFPGARFIILLRNPAAVLSSILQTWVKDDLNRFDYFRDDLLAAPRLLTNFASETPRSFVVRYESLILHPDETIRALCEQLGLPYYPGMLDYGRRARPRGRYGDPTGIEKFDRPSADNLHAWLDHAQDPQIHHLLSAYTEALGPDLIAAMGYDFAQLNAELDRVPQRSGRISVRWEQLMRRDKSTAERLHLIIAGGRQGKRPLDTARKIAKLLVGK